MAPLGATRRPRRLVNASIVAANMLLAAGSVGLAGTPAKLLFGAKALPADMPSQAIGFYAKGCLAGANALPITGPTWQVTRLSRNRNWGHPELISFIERLSREAAEKDGWRGLLVGDMSQPRGGPMVNGHASHQIGLDADIWLTEMPAHVMSREERETIQFPSMTRGGSLALDPNTWTPAQGRLIMQAASDPQVERIFVAPAIKKRLCETWQGDRSVLGKVRPYWGHKSHMHVRLSCPAGSNLCKHQVAVPAGDGCGKQLSWWYNKKLWEPPKPAKPPKKPVVPYQTQLSDLPTACRTVLDAPSERVAAAYVSAAAPAVPVADTATLPAGGIVPVPTPRPTRP